MKFAYLILAHGSFELLKELLKALDSPDNDIYIHIDKKVGDVDCSSFLEVVNHSRLCFLSNRVDVIWGHVSVVEATMNLLEEAVKGIYDYYHLLSGVDFPIKSQSYIQSFFQKNGGKEFVGFSEYHTREEVKCRATHRLFKGRPHRKPIFVLRMNGLFVRLQRLFHVYSFSPVDNLRIGSQWFSITHALAQELVGQRKFVLERFCHVHIPDEMFLQTFLFENDYMDRVFDLNDEFSSCCRDIDWNRGNPYVWQDKDYEELVNSKYLWARKFSESNMGLVKKIAEYIIETDE